MADQDATLWPFPRLTFAEGSAPSTPSSGQIVAYAKTDGKLYTKDDAGTETPLGAGVIPWFVPPLYGANIEAVSAMTANDGVFVPCVIPAACTLTGIRLHVGNSAGNVSVALYDAAFARLATSGSVACPATGNQTVAFSAPYAAEPGRYWMALSASSASATFGRGSPTSLGGAPVTARRQASVHPLPDPASPSLIFGDLLLVGIVDGGWP